MWPTSTNGSTKEGPEQLPRSPGGWQFEWRGGPGAWHGDFEEAWTTARGRTRLTSVYHDLRFLRAWWQTVGAARDHQILLGRATHPGQPAVLMPWLVATYRGTLVTRTVVEYVGQEHAAYQDPLVDGDPAEVNWADFWHAARESIRGIADTLLLRFVSADVAAAEYSRPTDPSPVIVLSEAPTFESALSRASANHRGDLRRRLRRLAEHGRFDLWSPGTDEAVEAHHDWTTRFVPAYRRQWGEKGGGVLAAAGGEALLSRVVREGVAEGWASYRALRLDGQTIAWALLLREGRDDYWWVPAYDTAHEELAPGKVVLALLVEQSIAEGKRALHLLTGGQGYKMAWRPMVPPRVALGWHATSWRGRALQAYDAWRAPVSS